MFEGGEDRGEAASENGFALTGVTGRVITPLG